MLTLALTLAFTLHPQLQLDYEILSPDVCGVFFCVTISELLKSSLQVLTSSNVLLQSLRRLQRTEALQRSGGVLQEEGACEEVQVLVLIRVIRVAQGPGPRTSPGSLGFDLALIWL